MNRKKFVILALTLAMLLGMTTVAYAWSVGGYSSISTGLVTVTGTSTTTADTTLDTIHAWCCICRDGYVQNTGVNDAQNQSRISAAATGTNLPGNQTWEVYGIHNGSIVGVYKEAVSYTSTQW